MGWGDGPKTPSMTIAYSLSRSVIRITGQVTETEDSITGKRTKSAEAVSELLTVADLSPDAQKEITIPGGLWSDTVSTIVLRDDRRLESIEASFTGKGPKVLKAATVGLGVVAGGILAFAAPPIGIPLLAGSLGAATRFLMREADAPPVTDDEKRFDKFSEAFKEEAEMLRRYRVALAKLTEAHAVAAEAENFEALEKISKELALIRAEAAIYEMKYVEWCLDQIRTTKSPIESADFAIGELPDEDNLRKMLHTADKTDRSERHLLASTPRWAVVARKFGIAVSVDLLEHQRAAQPPIGGGEIELSYRPGTDVILRIWKVTLVDEVDGVENTPIDENEIKPSSHYSVSLVDSKATRVVIESSKLVTFGLDVRIFRSGKMKVTFNDLGEPKEIGSEASSQAADAIAEFGDNLKAGLETGSAISAAVVPGSATQAYLERQVAITKSRNELAAPSADAKALADLQGAVQIAELEARLRLARQAALQTSGSVIYSIGV